MCIQNQYSKWSAPPQESKPDYDLPPVIVRKSSFKEVSQKTKSKRTDNPNYTLAPVKLNNFFLLRSC
jgi:hypothetical protein